MQSTFAVGDNVFHTLLANMTDGVYITDTNRRILYWNKAAETISGYSAEEVIGHCCADGILMHTDAEGYCLCRLKCPLAHTMTDREKRSAKLFLHHKDGYRLPVSVTVVPLLDDGGTVTGGLEIFSDARSEMTALRETDRLREQALMCDLTGVGNRRYAEQMLTRRFEGARKGDAVFGMLFMDVDHFKSINDSYGHQVGDIVLKMVARTMANAMRQDDFLARWGGEEFIAVLDGMRGPQLIQAAERIRALVEQSSVRASKGTLRVTVSIGATSPNVDDTIETIVARADKLMYTSKTSGRNRVTIG